MDRSAEFWLPVCGIVMTTRCWARLRVWDGPEPRDTDWSTLLTLPVPGYIEVGEGPFRIRETEWLEVSTLHIRGGLRGRPREFVDVTDELVARLHEAGCGYEAHASRWTLREIVVNEPLTLVRVKNPFFSHENRAKRR